MATFNPGSQDEQEKGYNPMMWTKPMDQPKGSQAGKYRAEAAGGLAAGLTQFGVDTQQNWLKGSLYNEMEPIRDEYQRKYDQQLAGLEEDGTGPQIVPPSTSEQTRQDVMTEPYNYKQSHGGLPDDAKQGLTQDLSALVGAGPSRANKLRPLDYDTRIAMVAQRWRKDWPGERDIIDEEVNKFTGRGIANKVLRDTMQRINDLQGQRAAGMGIGLSYFEKPEVIAALGNHYNEYLAQYINSGGNKAVLASAMMNAAPYIQKRQDWENAKLFYEEQKDKQGYVDSTLGKAWLNSSLGEHAAQQNRQILPGGSDVSPVLDQALSGATADVDRVGKQAMEIRNTLSQQLARMNAKLDDPINPADPQGPKVRDRLSPDFIRKGFQDVTTQANDLLKALGAENVTPFTFAALRNKAIEEAQLTGWLLLHPDVGFQMTDDFKKLPLEIQKKVEAADLINWKTSPKQDALQQHALGLSLISQSDPPGKKTADLMEIMQESGAKGRVFMDGLTRNANDPKILKDPKVLKDTIDNIASNQIRIDRFAEGFRDPKTGMWVEGKTDLFTNLFNDKLINAAAEHGYLPKLEEAAKNDMIGIFKSTYNNLHETPPGLLAMYDDVHHQFHIDVDPKVKQAEEIRDLQNADIPGMTPLPHTSVPSYVQDAARNMNVAIGVMAKFANKIDPTRIDDYIVEALIHSGADLSGLKWAPGVSNQIVQSFLASRQAKKDAEAEAQEQMDEEGGRETKTEGLQKGVESLN